MKGIVLALLLLGWGGLSGGDVVPTGLVPVPDEPAFGVELAASRSTYAPGELLEVEFSLTHEAYVYLYNVTAEGEVKLLVPNRFLQDPKFSAGTHTLPKEGWRMRVTEPEGMEYLQLIATAEPLDFYEAERFAEEPFLEFSDPRAFADKLTELVGDDWGTAWTGFRIYRPRATLHVESRPRGAQVWAAGQRLGTTPLTDTVDAGATTVEIRLAGYETVTRRVELDDGDEAHIVVELSPTRPRAPRPPTVEVELPLGVGFAFGFDPEASFPEALSIGFELWSEVVGLGLAISGPPPSVDWGAPGPEETVAWGPKLEAYAAGWLSLENDLGLYLSAGLSFQEMVDLPEWAPQGAYPAVVIEPEPDWQVTPALGAGLGVDLGGWRVYLGWNTSRGAVLGLTLTP